MKDPKTIREILESEPKNMVERFEQMDLENLPDTLSFNAQYNDPRWFEKRDEILELNNHQCQDCTGNNVLQVHHGYYELGLMAWEYENDTMWCLCEECHEKWGKFKRMLQKELAKIDFSNEEKVYFLIKIFQKINRNSTVFNKIFDKSE